MHLDRGGVQLYRLDANAHEWLPLQQLKNLVQHAVFGPAIPAGVNRMPRTKTLGQSAPLAALLGNLKEGVEKLQMGHFPIAALARQCRLNALKLRFGEFHELTIPQKSLSVNMT